MNASILKSSSFFKMNRSDVIRTVATNCDLSQGEATRAVSGTLDAIATLVANGHKVQLMGFGSFTSRQRKARQGTNPRTGEAIDIPAKKVPRFTPSEIFMEQVNMKTL